MAAILGGVCALDRLLLNPYGVTWFSYALPVLAHPSDITYGTGTYELTTSIPPWASENPTWGLSSYAANWQVFGDRGTKFGRAIKDGTMRTIMFTEKYAVTSRPSGSPAFGASLFLRF